MSSLSEVCHFTRSFSNAPSHLCTASFVILDPPLSERFYASLQCDSFQTEWSDSQTVLSTTTMCMSHSDFNRHRHTVNGPFSHGTDVYTKQAGVRVMIHLNCSSISLHSGRQHPNVSSAVLLACTPHVIS